MGPRRGMAVATALCLALAAAGCGLGAGEEVGRVKLTVTREFGSVPMLQREIDGHSSDTVMRLLESSAEIDTRYGGGFVESIDGVSEEQRDGDPYDWFFYVDGTESPIGAADVSIRGGERIWWDHRNWSTTTHVPAVVGSWPAPFAYGFEGIEPSVEVECETGEAVCRKVRRALTGAGAAFVNRLEPSERSIRVLVGPWARLRSDPAAAQIERGPGVSGVFAEFFDGAGGYRLRGLNQEGEPVREFGAAAGLVAATRRYEQPPVWVITGSTAAGVRAAAGLLRAEKLRDRYAVATDGGRDTALPVPGAKASEG
jgi:hypothetical protein